MTALSKATTAQLQYELLRRAITRAKMKIEAMELALFQMREKQANRHIELSNLSVFVPSKINNPKSKIRRRAA